MNFMLTGKQNMEKYISSTILGLFLQENASPNETNVNQPSPPSMFLKSSVQGHSVVFSGSFSLNKMSKD